MMTKEELAEIRARRDTGLDGGIWSSRSAYELIVNDIPKLLGEVERLQQKETKTEVEIVFRDWDKQADHCKEIGLSIERSCFGSCAAFWSHCLAFDDICNNSACRDLREKLDDS